MNNLDFDTIEDKPLVPKKSYNDSLDDKFGKNTRKAKVSEKENTTIRKTKTNQIGWSLSGDIETEFIQEYDGQNIIRTVSFVHPRIQMEQFLEDGKPTETLYLLDGQYPLRAETAKGGNSRGNKMENLYLFDGDKLIFKRHFYLNKTCREEFSLDAGAQLTKEDRAKHAQDKIDMRFFNSKGELASPSGQKQRLAYKPYQINFYAPKELSDIVTEVAAERGFESKSTMITKLILGTLDDETALILKDRLKEQGVTTLYEDN